MEKNWCSFWVTDWYVKRMSCMERDLERGLADCCILFVIKNN